MDAATDALKSSDFNEDIEFYRQNHAEMEKEIRTLISDNQKLSQQVAALLKEKLEYVRLTQNSNHTEADDLRRRVSLLAKERDSLHVLWQSSQKTIEALEIELKTYQSYQRSEENQNFIDNKRDLELKLDSALSDYVELESRYKELQTKYNTLENKLKSVENEIIAYKERGKEMQLKIEDLSNDLDTNKVSLGVENKNNELLKEQLLRVQKECSAMVRKEAEAKSKVAEALQLFDVVNAQKNEAMRNINALIANINELKASLANVERNFESAFRKELDEVKEKYNEKIVDMLQHIKNLDSELAEKGLLLNKSLREMKILQTANEEYLKEQNDKIKSINPKLAIAEKKLETMFQELVISERRNIQVVCEKQCLAIDLQRAQDIHAREIKRRDWEEKLLKTQCEDLKVQVEHLQKSLEETHGMVNKFQSMLTSRDELNQKIISTKEAELTELNKHLENQMDLNKKWKASYIQMAEKLKQSIKTLEMENKELKSKLQISLKLESTDDLTST